MNALTLLRHLSEPDSRKPFVKEPGLGLSLSHTGEAGCYATATDGRVLLAVRSDRFRSADGTPRLLADDELDTLGKTFADYRADAQTLVARADDLILWCDAPYFPDQGDEFLSPDRTGILLGLPIDRVRLANLLCVAYWLVMPLASVEIRRCPSKNSKGACDVLYFTGKGERGDFLGVLMPLTAKDPAAKDPAATTAGWPVFVGSL